MAELAVPVIVWRGNNAGIAGLTKAAALELGDAFPLDGGILAGIMMGE